jgi:hypothetical protein
MYSSKKRFAAVGCAIVYSINMSVNTSELHCKWVKNCLYEMEEYNHELLRKAPITILETAICAHGNVCTIVRRGRFKNCDKSFWNETE